MKIVHLSFSSSSGPGFVANRISNFMSNAGIDSKVLVVSSNSSFQLILSDPIKFLLILIDHFLVNKNRKLGLFSLFRSKVAFSKINKELLNCDFLFLYWVTGVFDLKTISQIEGGSTKIIWRLSDMEPFTGGCHYSDDCSQFKTHCNNCPRVFKLFKGKVTQNLENKYNYLSKSNIEFIAPSRWIEFAARNSLVLSGKTIHYIPTPCETDIFKPLPEQILIRETFNLGFMAKNICDPIKNIEKTVNRLLPFLSSINRNFKIYLIGNGLIELKNIPENIELIHVGTVDDKIELNLILNVLDVFISPALLENFPSSVLEAQSAGVPVVCQKNGGQFEIVQHESTGFHFLHEKELFDHLTNLIFDSKLLAEMRIKSRKHINENYSMQSIMKEYFKLLRLNS